MKSIIVLAWSRPDYLKRTLEALSQCKGVRQYEVYVSVDHANAQQPTLLLSKAFGGAFDHGHYHVLTPKAGNERLGINRHPLAAYDAVLDQGSDFNVVFEDDVVPAPDALELCDWFYGLPERDQYACLCLHSHSRIQDHPLSLYEEMSFAPWGWAFTKQAWETIFKPNWSSHPNGWDWSCHFIVKKNGLKVLRPVLSRVLNIGREGGTHMSASHWDEWAKGLVCSDGTHGNEYSIDGRLPEGYATANEMEPWVKENLERQQGEHTSG
jgi:hypothetical protein